MFVRNLLAAAVGLTGYVVDAFTNPIVSGVNADPSAIRVGDDYYLVTSSFEYFPGLPIYHSKNLVDWTIVGHGLLPANAIYDRQLLTTGGIFAPTLRHHNGTFYLVTNYADGFNPSDQRPFLITTKNVSGNWSEPIYFDQTGIDPDLFFDDDGSIYLSTALPENGPMGGNSTIWQSKVDLSNGHSLTEPKMIYASDLPLKIRWAEGSHIYKINGTYYLAVAEGGTEVLHRETIHRSSSPSGPWEASPLGPLVFNSKDPSLPVQQTGHADLFQRPDGSWYTVFLAVRPQLPQNLNGTYQLGRETFLSNVTWKDGWPLANNGNPITLEMNDPNIPSAKKRNDWSDDFSSPQLKSGWEFRGTPYGDWYHISNSSLVLRGNQRTLHALDGMALILRKQDDLNYDFIVDLEFKPYLATHEAGIVAWVNDDYHDTVSVQQCESQSNNQTSSLCLKTVIVAQGATIDGNATTTWTPIPKGSVANGVANVRLHIRAEPEVYHLGYSTQHSQTPVWLTNYTATWMAPHSGGRISWQGARVGVFATGNGVPMLTDAKFRDVHVVKGSSVKC